LEKSKVEAIKWKTMVERSKGKKKEEAPRELEKQLHHLQEKFQIMTMQKVEYNQKLR
jgi:hypothetical protein